MERIDWAGSGETLLNVLLIIGLRLILFLSPFLYRILRERGLAAIERLMGMLLVMMASPCCSSAKSNRRNMCRQNHRKRRCLPGNRTKIAPAVRATAKAPLPSATSALAKLNFTPDRLSFPPEKSRLNLQTTDADGLRSTIRCNGRKKRVRCSS